ncbi:MAG: DUF1320 domain-containing protein [Bacteroidetes bacterium]|nr:DUF1320 domain-containing protein [Bacteroidota bacterium]MBX7046639.1 DUF1320 domain-containing protein [Ignavibacteria bacterium]
MAYTNKNYFLLKIKSDELERLTDNSDDVLNSAIASADSLIDTYLNSVFESVPIQVQSGTVPAIIQQCSYDIAIFYLHDRIQYSEIPQWVKDKYNAAVDFLTKIAKGTITLDVETENSGSNVYQKPDEGIRYSGNSTVMGRDSF